jgi:hypothetical protein
LWARSAAASGHGALTSFHSDSVQSAMIRMSAPPMLVPAGNMMLIWAFAVMNRVRREHGRVVRRVLSMTELEPKKGGFDLRELFSYNMVDDIFSPSAPEELVRMKTSPRFKGRLTIGLVMGKRKVRRGVAIRLNLMPPDWYLQTEQGKRAAKHVIEGTLTDEDTGERVTFTGAHKLLEAIYELQKKKIAQYRKGII